MGSNSRTNGRTERQPMDDRSSFVDNTLTATASPDRVEPDEFVDTATVISDRASTKESEIALIRSRLASSGAGLISRAASKLLKSPDRKLADSDWQAFRQEVRGAVNLYDLDRDLRKIQRAYRSKIEVVGPVNPYGPGSPHSWICDSLQARSTDGTVTDRVAPGCTERLARH